MPAQPPANSRTRAILHWSIAALVLFQIYRHHEIGRAWHAVHDGVTVAADVSFWANLHVFAGIAIFVLALWLAALRLKNGAPAAPANVPPFLRLIARATHLALYALILAAPASGLAAWYLDVQTAGRIHGLAELPAIALIVLHLAGALYQHFILRSGVVRNILPWR